MRIKKLFYYIKPPCEKCPYKLGRIQTLVNPCLQCKLNDYKSYELFERQLSRETVSMKKMENDKEGKDK